MSPAPPSQAFIWPGNRDIAKPKLAAITCLGINRCQPPAPEAIVITLPTPDVVRVSEGGSGRSARYKFFGRRQMKGGITI